MATLADVLTARAQEGAAELCERYKGDWVRCHACGHQCPIPNGAVGVCKVRFNRDGRLMVPWGYVAGAQCDPICLHCSFCQNWVTSQALRDPRAVAAPQAADPRALVEDAIGLGARVVVSTYNEPLITSEWAVAIFKEAKAAGLATGFVSNGNATAKVLEYLRPWLDFYKVDLKSFDDKRYRQLGGRLQPIVDTIVRLKEMGFWVEIVTLLVPGFNDSKDELTRLTDFIARVSPDIPWHVTAFHANYKMRSRGDTTTEMLVNAADIGRSAGLRFVYAGNLPGCVGDLENTRCPSCRSLLVSRYGYVIRQYRITSAGACPSCGTQVPGRWSEHFEPQVTSVPFSPRRRRGLDRD